MSAVPTIKLDNNFVFDISKLLSQLVSAFPAYMDDRHCELSQQTDIQGNVRSYTISFLYDGLTRTIRLDGDGVIHVDRGDWKWEWFDDHGCRNFEAAIKYIKGDK